MLVNKFLSIALFQITKSEGVASTNNLTVAKSRIALKALSIS